MSGGFSGHLRKGPDERNLAAQEMDRGDGTTIGENWQRRFRRPPIGKAAHTGIVHL